MLHAMGAAQRNIVHSRIAGDVRERVGRFDVMSAATYHHSELGLPIDPGCGIGGYHDGLARTDQRGGRRLEEEVRTRVIGTIDLHLAHVRVIVGARAENLARILQGEHELGTGHLGCGLRVEATKDRLRLRPELDQLEHTTGRYRQLGHASVLPGAGALFPRRRPVRDEAPGFHFLLAGAPARGRFAPASKNSWPGMPGPQRLAKRWLDISQRPGLYVASS